jgi:hypothetical protein
MVRFAANSLATISATVGTECLKLGRQIAVDLKTDTDLNEGRSGPSHGGFSFSGLNGHLCPTADVG